MPLRLRGQTHLAPSTGICFTIDEHVAELAGYLKVDPEIVRFTLTQLVKPYAAKKAEAFAELIQESKWLKGYCPICGSWPEMGFLEGREGRRWLRCSFCSHEWTFSRTECPFCESHDPDKLEIFYSEGRPFERAELCYECRKYLGKCRLEGPSRDSSRRGRFGNGLSRYFGAGERVLAGSRKLMEYFRRCSGVKNSPGGIPRLRGIEKVPPDPFPRTS